MTTETQALGLPMNGAIKYFREKVRIPSTHWTDVWRTAHTRGFMVAGATTDALLSDFQKSIQKAISDGTSYQTFRKDFDEIVAKHGWSYNGSAAWRSKIIYETNLSMAYAAGRWAELTEPETLATYPYWQYLHTACRHPRLQHLAWNGLVLRADDPWWQTHYPPNGWRCGCRVSPVGERALGRMGKSGPDTAPPLDPKPWINPKTGDIHQVPAGIDPGFDYNVGEAWADGGRHIPVRAERLRPLRAEAVEAPASELRPIDVNAIEAVPPADAPAVRPVDFTRPEAGFPEWIDKIVSENLRDGSARVVGQISDDLAEKLAERNVSISGQDISLSAKQAGHLSRATKQLRGQAIPQADLLKLPERLGSPAAVLLDKRTGNLVYVFVPHGARQSTLAKVVVSLAVKLTSNRNKTDANTIVTAGLVDAAALQDRNFYDVLEGEV